MARYDRLLNNTIRETCNVINKNSWTLERRRIKNDDTRLDSQAKKRWSDSMQQLCYGAGRNPNKEVKEEEEVDFNSLRGRLLASKPCLWYPSTTLFLRLWCVYRVTKPS